LAYYYKQNHLLFDGDNNLLFRSYLHFIIGTTERTGERRKTACALESKQLLCNPQASSFFFTHPVSQSAIRPQFSYLYYVSNPFMITLASSSQ
jgi:hypothetical protein